MSPLEKCRSSLRRLTVGVLGASLALSWLPAAGLAQERGHWRGGDGHRFHERDFGYWRGGNWWRGWHEGRDGWWWIAGGGWYWYPAPVYPYPDPYRPPLVAVVPGEVWYYCQNPAGYYPSVPACSLPWQAVPASPQPPPQAMPMAPPPMAPSSPGIDKATGGTVLGAIGGGVAGAQFGHGAGKLAAVAAGTLLGAFVGHEVGQSLDRADAVAAGRAERTAYQAPLGQAITWSNTENGHSGTIMPIREGQDSAGNTCREFQQSVVIDGKVEQANGTACRQPDGVWKVLGQ